MPMNRLNFLASLVATIGTALGLACGAAIAAKPINPGNGDPCAASNIDFPAFVYWKQSGSAQQFYVADATGNCSRLLYLVAAGSAAGGSISFAYPIAGTTNRGRIVWQEGPDVVAGDFTVSGTAVTLEPKRMIFSPVGCCSFELAPDGQHIYASTNDDTFEKISVDDPSTRVLLRTIADAGFVGSAAINGDESALYLSEYRSSPGTGITGAELIRIDLSSLQADVLVARNGSHRFWPAADPGSNRIAYTDYLPGSNNCYLLEIADGTTGATLSYGQPRYGVQSTWHAGKVLTNGYKSPNRQNRCLSMDSITEVDSLTSAERIVVINGLSPDAR